jgi:glycosyltransferase involved in cell wall biosynthesis
MTDVALISPFPPAGERHGGWTGVASYAAGLSGALEAAGLDVVVVADRLAPEHAASARGPVDVRRVWRRGPGALPRAARAALDTRAPVVHLQHELMLYGGASAAPGLLPALARLRAARRRTVVTLHHVLDPAAIDAAFTATHRVRAPAAVARAAVDGLQRGIRALADAVIVHEPAFAPLMPGAAVIPHGIEAAAAGAREAARAELGVDDDRLLALCFGFLAPYKGLELALEGVRAAGDGVRLVIAGGEHPRLPGGYGERLRAAAPPGTLFTGFVPDADVPRWFAAADVALLLYPQPFATSGALAAALSYGTPVLLSPGFAHVMDAPDALAVELEPEALGERLRALAERPDERAALRTHAESLASGRGWPDVARRHLEVYR